MSITETAGQTVVQDEVPQTVSTFFVKDAALEAEILWSIKTVVEH